MRFDYMGADGAIGLNGAIVTPNFFDVLGAGAARGRTFRASDATSEAAAVVLSDGVWRRVFGGDSKIIGRTIRLTFGAADARTTRTCTVIGVLAERFVFSYPEHTDIWALLPWAALEADAHGRITPLEYFGVGRLKQGYALAQAEAQLSTIDRQIDAEQGWEHEKQPPPIESLHDFAVGSARTAIVLSLAAACFLLVIACANVAALLLGRCEERLRELTMRSALGASSGRLAQQLVTESLLLAILGGLLAVLLALSVQPALRALLPPNMPRADEVELGGWTWLLAIVVPVATTLTAAAAPARYWMRVSVHRSLSETVGTATAGVTARRRRVVLIGLQVAVVTVLLSGTGLLLHSFFRLYEVDLGFDGRRVIVVGMRVERTGGRASWRPAEARADLAAFQQRLRERARIIPGVVEAATTSDVPFSGGNFEWTVQRPDRPGWRTVADSREVGPGCLELLRIRLLAGRSFGSNDTPTSPSVVIVSKSLAEAAFPNENPIGKHLSAHANAEVVGVVADVRHQGMDKAARATIYVPFAQYQVTSVYLLARTDGRTAGVPRALRAAIADLRPEQPIRVLTTLDRLVSDSVAERRLVLVLTAAFGLIGLALAVVGLYGVVSRAVTRRIKEIGVRVVLGARPRDVAVLVLSQGLTPVALGLGGGLLASLWTGQLLRAFLFEVRADDVLTWLATASVVSAASIAACVVPTLRAVRLAPSEALRRE
jgi:predicted permease